MGRDSDNTAGAGDAAAKLQRAIANAYAEALALCRKNAVEVFRVDGAQARENRKRNTEDSDVPLRAGWYYWTCHPGCLPDSAAFGPFSSEGAAALDAVDMFDLE